MSPIPAATLADNRLTLAVAAGEINPDQLGPLAGHLDELVRSNIASTRLMAHRHRGTVLADVYALSHQSEVEAGRQLGPFVDACHGDAGSVVPLDALALAYPAHIARIAVMGSPWDYPVLFLHLCRASTACYRRLHDALAATGAFTPEQLAHFDYFSDVDDDEIAAIEALLADAPADALACALERAQHLATLEELFWHRMLALCSSQPHREGHR